MIRMLVTSLLAFAFVTPALAHPHHDHASGKDSTLVTLAIVGVALLAAGLYVLYNRKKS